MAIEYPMIALIALSIGLTNVCEYVGPNHVNGWDYDCGIVTVRPPQPPVQPEPPAKPAS